MDDQSGSFFDFVVGGESAEAETNLRLALPIEELASALLRPIARRTWDGSGMPEAQAARLARTVPGGRGKLRLNRAKDILSSKTPEPQVGVARWCLHCPAGPFRATGMPLL